MTEARLAVLTNGVIYKFYSDIDSPNRMDEKPFFTLDLDAVRKSDHRILTSFTKASFDIDKIVDEASRLKLQTLVYKELQQELENPSEEFVRIIAGRVQPGRLTAQVKDNFHALIVASASTLIRDRVNERLTNALQGNGGDEPEPVEQPLRYGITVKETASERPTPVPSMFSGSRYQYCADTRVPAKRSRPVM